MFENGLCEEELQRFWISYKILNKITYLCLACSTFISILNTYKLEDAIGKTIYGCLSHFVQEITLREKIDWALVI